MTVMPLVVTIALTIVVTASARGQQPAGTESTTRVALTHVTVIDGTGAPPHSDATVIVVDGRIDRIGSSRTVAVPKGAEVHDLSGRFLIPGLWNMHVHAVGYDEAVKAMPSVLATGITGVRDMGAPIEDVLRLRGEINGGLLRGPQMVVAGPLLEGPLPPAFATNPMLKPVADTETGRQAVAALKARGVDFIKISDSVPRDAYFAVAAEAKRLRIAFAGHVPPVVSASEASDAGQHSIEHLGGQHHAVLRACSDREEEAGSLAINQLKDAIAAVFAGKEPDERSLFQTTMIKPIVDGYSASKAAALFARFAKNGTWQTPTLITLEHLWDRKDLTAEDLAYGERVKQLNLWVVRAMHAAGVRILAGTDGPLSEAGGLHDELALIVRAGLSPLQALQSATRDAAEYVGRATDLGTIERGKVADLVVLEASPLVDIENTRRVEAVVLQGHFLAVTSLTRQEP